MAMPGKRYSENDRLTAVAWSRTLGIDGAAVELGIDRRTVASWVADAPEPDTDEALRALEADARLALHRMLRGGKLAPLNVLRAWGTAWDKLLKRQVATPTPKDTALTVPERPEWVQRVRALPLERQRYITMAMDVEIEREKTPEEQAEKAAAADMDVDKAMLAWVADVESMTDEEIAAESAELTEIMAEQERARLAHVIDVHTEPQPLEGQVLDPWEPGLTPQGRWMENVTPEPPSAHWEDWQAIEAAQEAHNHD